MKVQYKNYEIEVTKKKCLAGYDMIFFNIFTKDGFEIACSFTESEDTVQSIVEDCKEIVDDFILHPEDYEDN